MKVRTFTCSFGSGQVDRGEVHAILIGMTGCSVAWGSEGRPIKEIAWHLNLSERTVEFHKGHMMETFNLKSNANMVLFALKQGLISLDSGPVQTQNSS